MGKSSGNGDSRGGLLRSLTKTQFEEQNRCDVSINGGTILIRSTAKVLEKSPRHLDSGQAEMD